MSMTLHDSLKSCAQHGVRKPGNVSWEDWDVAFSGAQREEMDRLRRKWAWARPKPERPKPTLVIDNVEAPL